MLGHTISRATLTKYNWYNDQGHLVACNYKATFFVVIYSPYFVVVVVTVFSLFLGENSENTFFIPLNILKSDYFKLQNVHSKSGCLILIQR